MVTERPWLGYGLFLLGLAVSYLKGFGSEPKDGTPEERTTRLFRAREFRHRLWWVLGSLVVIGAGLYLMS